MRKAATIICLLLAAVLIVVGLVNNQATAVLTKASKICLECIGIG